MIKYLETQSGLSIIATILTLLILSLFMAVAVSLVTTGSNIAVQEEQGQQAFNIANAGLQKTLNYIIKQKDAACTTSETCACDDADDYANTNPTLGAGSFNVATTSTYITNPTTLSGDINATVASIPVISTANYAASGRIMIDREVIEYTSLTANSFEGCKRGVAGTTAATHSSGTRVGQKQCLIASTGTISANPLATIRRQVAAVTELQNGWIAGGGGAENLNEVHCTASNNCWAVGDTGTIMQWDGTAWRKVTSPTTQDLNSVFMVSATDGWAVGDEDGNEVILRWNGATWSRLGPFAAVENYNLNSVYMVSATEVWIVGDDRGGGPNAVAYRWRDTDSDGIVDAAEWTYFDPGTDEDLNSVYMLSANDGWTVGDNGVIRRWNGVNWSNTNSPTGENINSVYMVSISEVWIVGDDRPGANNAVAYRWYDTDSDGIVDAGEWTYFDPGTDENLNSIYMLSTNNGWAMGDNGTIIRWNGANWSPAASPTTENLNSVYIVSASDGWAVGDNGAILRWDGTAWSSWGGGRMLRWNGAAWTDKTSTLPAGIDQTLRSVSMLSYVDGWVVGNRINNTNTGWTILRWNPAGNTWTLYSSISPATGAQTLRSVSMVSANDGWSVGNRTGAVTNGWIFLRWNNPTANTWNRYTITTAGVNAQNLNAVSMLDTTAPPDGTADDGWAVGNRTAAANNGWTLFRWNNPTANTWNLYNTVNPATTAENLRGVYCLSNRECWATGDSGTVLNWNGSQWNVSTSPTIVDLNSVYVIGTTTPSGQWKEVHP